MLKLFKRQGNQKQQQGQDARPAPSPGARGGSGDQQLFYGEQGSDSGGVGQYVDPPIQYRQPLVPPPHRYENQHSRSNSGAYNGLNQESESGAHPYAEPQLSPNPYALGPRSFEADQNRPFSPESAQLRTASPNGYAAASIGGAYESYSEQHDSAPSKADRHGGKQGRTGSGGVAKLEKSKKNFMTHSTEGKITDKIDSISSSEADAKEAARAIRKEFKYAEPEAQRRAIRIWAILMINASDRFRMQIANKRFLEVVEHVATSSKTDPTVSEKMLNVLAVLAYLYQSDADLGIITKCWNKIKPKDRPLNGEPVDPDSEDFNPPILNPPIRKVRSSGVLPPRALTPNGGQYDENPYENGFEQPKPVAPRANSDKNKAEAPVRKNPRDYSHRIISPDEDMRKLHEECHVGRTNAIVLIDALTTSGLSSPLLDEFAHKVQLSQMFLVGQIDWATAQATRSREYMDEQAAIAATQGLEPPQLEETREEILLADILAANERLMEAQQMLDDARRHQAEEAEEAAVRERSRVETRMGRDATGAPVQAGGGDGVSFGTSSSSGTGQAPPVPGQTNGAMGSGNGLLVNVPLAQHARGPLPRTPPLPPSPQPVPNVSTQAQNHVQQSQPQSQPQLQPQPQSPPLQQTMPPRTYAEDEDIQTPVVPSEKALGKRRAFSDRGEAFDPEIQARVLAEQAPVHIPVKLHEVLEQDDTE
ncbi:hypothetical protein A4X09_0g2238 [Tilletia walkeri]|uniref:VHS domain-containing protein n=1 Tax=Tilletia walkeri TaxID=117179 RepID=A0A8X7ND70_9BASI|nr:hypothetical protein A4X09_0g2238 [Tilletia walkeri]